MIDINSRGVLGSLADFEEVRVRGRLGCLEVRPSVRAAYVHRRLQQLSRWRVLELFAGGGAMSAALRGHPGFALAGGCEIDVAYSDVWQSAHPDAELILADVRRVHPSELPPFEVLVAGIPCTSHSALGRAKHGLKGCPELGETGDLFLPVVNFVSHRMPLACVFENVPSFGESLAGQLLTGHLARLGYHVSECVLEPFEEWGEVSDRRRWVGVACLRPGFKVQPPMRRFTGTAAEFLDAPDDARDHADAERIAQTVAGLRRHQERHRSQGHGFGFSVINKDSPRIPTIIRSYHKINSGPFVETPHGLRLLRKSEIERVMGHAVDCEHYATAVEILGQGVQTRVFTEIFRQLGNHLAGQSTPTTAGQDGDGEQMNLFS